MFLSLYLRKYRYLEVIPNLFVQDESICNPGVMMSSGEYTTRGHLSLEVDAPDTPGQSLLIPYM